MRAYVGWAGGVGGVSMCNCIKMCVFLTAIQRTEPDYMSRYKLVGTLFDCLLNKWGLPSRGEKFLFIHRRV